MGCKNSSDRTSPSPTKKTKQKTQTQKTKILIVFYSTYGHVYKLAQAIAEGAQEVSNVQVDVRRVQETLSDEILEKMHALEAKKQWENIPLANVNELDQYDGIIFGSSTRYGLMAAQMKQFIDSLGDQWFGHAFVGKAAGVFGCTGSQHGGNEMALWSTLLPLMHLGFTIVGQKHVDNGELNGGTNFGPSTFSGMVGMRQPTEKELAECKAHGKNVAEIAAKLAK